MKSIFAGSFAEAYRKTNRQLPVLLKVFLALCLYFLRDFLFLAVLIAAGTYLQNSWRYVFEIGAGLEVLWVFIKINGAIGIITSIISTGEGSIWQIARRGYKQSGIFFWNGLVTGVLLLFGQTLIFCPCFLFLNNFLFSSHLFIYENLRGKAAKKRSKELAAGFGWMILNRTVVFIFIGYVFLFFIAMLLYIKFFGLAIILVLVSALYFSQLQANYIRQIYQRTLEAHDQGVTVPAGSSYKLVTVFSIFVLFLIYVAIKFFSPHVQSNF